MKWIVALFLLSGMLQADELLINTQNGQTYVFDVDPCETLGMIQDRISALTDESAYVVAIPSNSLSIKYAAGKQGGYIGYPRDYTRPVTQQERDDIHYIVSTLADKSLITISFIKGDLESAGDRIDHLHPLRFFMTVFTSEELKAGIRNIRGRGWIWGHFVGGIKECLNTEMSIGNMKDEYIVDFARTVEIDVNKIYSLIQSYQWDAFIETLIREIPRKGDHNRYDN